MQITQKHGEEICKKLGGYFDESTSSHDQVVIFHKGEYVARYGIRRSSKDVHHGHVPRALNITPNQTLRLARCEISKDEYFETIESKS